MKTISQEEYQQLKDLHAIACAIDAGLQELLDRANAILPEDKDDDWIWECFIIPNDRTSSVDVMLERIGYRVEPIMLPETPIGAETVIDETPND